MKAHVSASWWQRIARAVASCACLVLGSAAAHAADATIHTQGMLQSSSGVPVSGTFTLVFGLYTAQTGGTKLWEQTLVDVPVAGGVFDVDLPAIPEELFRQHPAIWLQTAVQGEAPLPRSQLRPTPQALHARYADAAASAAALQCSGCVGGGHLGAGAVGSAAIADGSIASADVGFNYAGATSKGGAAVDLACTSCVAGAEVGFNYASSATKGGAADDLACSGCVADSEVAFNYAAAATKGGAATDVACTTCIGSGEVDFPYAASATKGGAATDVACSGCISSGKIAAGGVTTTHIADNAIQPADIGFNYAGSTAKGGPAADVACSGCVSSDDVGFNYAGSNSKGGPVNDIACTDCVSTGEVSFGYAASASKGGPAADLACASCVETGEIADGTITGSDIADNSIGSADVGFNYAGSNSKGGPVNDVSCSGCIAGGEIEANPILNGTLKTKESLQSCLNNTTGCGVRVSDDGGFFDRNDAWITMQVTSGLRVMNQAANGWTGVESGGLTVHGNAQVDGTLNVSGFGGTLDKSWDGYPSIATPGETELRIHAHSGNLNLRVDGWIYSHTHIHTGGNVYTDSTFVKQNTSGSTLVSPFLDVRADNGAPGGKSYVRGTESHIVVNAGNLGTGTLYLNHADTGNPYGGGTIWMGGPIWSICRLCIYYGDCNGGCGRRLWCVRFTNGANTGFTNLLGGVDSNDVFAYKFMCDNGPTGTWGDWHWY